MATSDIQSAFHEYVSKHEEDPERAQTIVHTAEDSLPEFIRKNFDEHFTSLYDVKNKGILDFYGEHIAIDSILKSQDSSINDVGYIATLTIYRRFMKSKLYAETIDPTRGGLISDPTPHEQDIDKNLVEGAILQGEHYDKHERNKEARNACIAYYRTLHHGHVVCECCGFDFEKAYGEMGRDFIEVHHRKPISQTDGEHAIDPKKDLVPLCSNCHSMIHRLAKEPGDCITLEELKGRYIGKVYTDE